MKDWQKALLGLTIVGGGGVLIWKLAEAREEKAKVKFVKLSWD